MKQEMTNQDDNNSTRRSSRLSIPTAKTTDSPKKQKSAFKWKLNQFVEARDSAKNWYKSKIIQVDLEKNKVKIHFHGWNSRYDQWHDANSDNLRAVKEKSSNKSKVKLNSQEKSSNETEISFELGNTIMAKWIDDLFYPAVVKRHLIKNEKTYYEVKFLDGVKKLINISNLRQATPEELALHTTSTTPSTTTLPLEKEIKPEEIEKEECKIIVEDNKQEVKIEEEKMNKRKIREEPKLNFYLQFKNQN